ncbi:MAG: 2-hydroxychromene-2-carboxylate isomerase [Pelagibacteraceae bacterium TMED233]|nr:MAG: 2-hydroxychromene-2-carboxylate isomerase [Pelagibacteraceae bacterium TMED233]|tara:strand:+ start:2735 stop:3322 length:588 start_codon:yes stop_codon:yes gene_type:complete
MNKKFDFYFDFISPYSYLAHKQIDQIKKKTNIEVIYKPILLGGLHKLSGITPHAFIPSKSKYMIKDCKIISEKFNIPFKFNSYFPINSISIMRGVFFAEEKKKLYEYINAFFDAYWKQGLNLSENKNIELVLNSISINNNEFNKFISNERIKNKLKEETNIAYDKGVFGAPSFIINNKLFWGQDRIEFVLKEINK